MSKGSRFSLFPASQRDVSRLRQSATDAVNDFGATAGNHAGKVKDQLQDLAGHVQEEGGANFERLRGSVINVANVAYEFATERPLVCIGAALLVGFIIGAVRRSPKKSND
jgi:ElaB/YqjD/DUF883 family membrane-anchored ribosome-binding protein